MYSPCLFMQEEEFNWLLKEEVHSVLKQLQDILKVHIKYKKGGWKRIWAVNVKPQPK